MVLPGRTPTNIEITEIGALAVINPMVAFKPTVFFFFFCCWNVETIGLLGWKNQWMLEADLDGIVRWSLEDKNA